jgi:hypothetical protein
VAEQKQATNVQEAMIVATVGLVAAAAVERLAAWASPS